MTTIKRKPRIKPMAGRVVVNPETMEEVTQGGIILLHDFNPSNMQRGVVVAVGNPLPTTPIQCKYMDTILFDKKAGVEVEIEGYTYKIIRQSEIIGVL